MQSRVMNYKVRAWLFLFRLRERWQAARCWYYEHAPLCLLKLQLRYLRWKLG